MHLQKNVDRAVEHAGAIQKLSRSALRHKLADRSEHHVFRTQDPLLTVADDQFGGSLDRLPSELNISGLATGRCARELERGIERAGFEAHIILHHETRIQVAVDDLAPGLAVREEARDLATTQSEGIMRLMKTASIDGGNFRVSQRLAVDRIQNVRRHRKPAQ